MDGGRFDDLTRIFAERRTRRGVLRGLGAGLVSGVTLIRWRVGEVDAVSRKRILTRICHVDARLGTYTPKNVASSVVKGYLRRGDILPESNNPWACGPSCIYCAAHLAEQGFVFGDHDVVSCVNGQCKLAACGDPNKSLLDCTDGP